MFGVDLKYFNYNKNSYGSSSDYVDSAGDYVEKDEPINWVAAYYGGCRRAGMSARDAADATAQEYGGDIAIPSPDECDRMASRAEEGDPRSYRSMVDDIDTFKYYLEHADSDYDESGGRTHRRKEAVTAARAAVIASRRLEKHEKNLAAQNAKYLQKKSIHEKAKAELAKAQEEMGRNLSSCDIPVFLAKYSGCVANYKLALDLLHKMLRSKITERDVQHMTVDVRSLLDTLRRETPLVLAYPKRSRDVLYHILSYEGADARKFTAPAIDYVVNDYPSGMYDYLCIYNRLKNSRPTKGIAKPGGYSYRGVTQK